MRNSNLEKEHGTLEGAYLNLYWTRYKSGAPIRIYAGDAVKVAMYAGNTCILGKLPFKIPDCGKIINLIGSTSTICGFLQIINNTVYLTPYATIQTNGAWIYIDVVII